MRNRQVFIPIAILAIVTLGCSLFSSSGDSEVVFAATEVGTPEGDKITKDIGPDGGTLSSPDGRMTLRVPPNALTETVAFSIQPITNKAGNGIGLAYRLEPDGKTFTTPLEISVRYDEKDLEGTVPEAFSLAYQDTKGAWHAQNSAKLDQGAKTLTISTTHFTDFAFLSRLRMSPLKATLYVGESQSFRLVICRELSFIDRLRGVDPRDTCTSAPPGTAGWRLSGEGTLADYNEGVIYTAPDRKPSPNTAYVDHTIEFEVRNAETGELSGVKKTFRALVVILARGYRASGQDGPVVYSGLICNLEEPFTVDGIHPIFPFPFKFIPSSATTGTMSYVTGASGISASGGGPYTIEGADTDAPRIVIRSKSTASLSTTTSGGGTATINLVPLETGECS